jgi:hypothetical protein
LAFAQGLASPDNKSMFNLRKFTAIFITRGKIRSAVFSAGGRMIGKEKTFDWTLENLVTALKEIASNGPNRARVVFGEEFSYTTAIKIRDKNRENVLKEALEVIPEELQNNWDFREGSDPSFPSQVAAVQKIFFDFFAEEAKKASLEIEAIEPQSVALVRLLPPSGFFVFVARDEKLLFGAVKNGVVVATFVAKDRNDISSLESFFSGARKKCGAPPEKVFVGDGIRPDAAIFLKNNLPAQQLDLNPLRAAALKKDLSGEDWRVLNITSSEKSPRGKLFRLSRKEKALALLLGAALLTLVGMLIFKWIKN